MTINNIGNSERCGRTSNLKNAMAAGALSAGLQTLILPTEVKANIKNAIIGHDAFLKQTGKAAVKTIKNLDKAGFEKVASKINVRETVERASAMYPGIVKNAKSAVNVIGRTFAGVTAGVLIGNFIADKLFGKKEQ